MDKFSFKKLKSVRENKRLTLAEVSIETGISPGHLNQLERGVFKDIKNRDKRLRLIEFIKSNQNN